MHVDTNANIECAKSMILLALFLSGLLDAPGHWNAPMLPDDHPSSFCKLTGLASGELCLVLEASDFVVKQGKSKRVKRILKIPVFTRLCYHPSPREAGQKQEFIQFPE
jgi:hypothetical protein